MVAQCYLYYGKKSSDNKQLIFQSYVIDTGRTIFQPSVLSADGNEIKNRVNLIDTLYICINWNVLLLFLRNFSKFYLLISMLIKEEDVIERELNGRTEWNFSCPVWRSLSVLGISGDFHIQLTRMAAVLFSSLI